MYRMVLEVSGLDGGVDISRNKLARESLVVLVSGLVTVVLETKVAVPALTSKRYCGNLRQKLK